MQLSDWFTLTTDRLGDPQYFLKSPFRSHYFVGNTFILLMDIFLCVYIVLRYWGELPQAGLTVVWLAVVIFGLLMLWGRALLDHRKVRQSLNDEQARKLDPNSPLEIALRAAATSTHLGLYSTFFLVAALLIQLGWAIRGSWPPG